MSAITQGPLPLVIGVTGHLDLREQDVPALTEVLRNQIQTIQRSSPHTPLVVLSPLAEGADRLAASVALDLGAQLVVPLPLPCDVYEKDFATAESRAEFRRLLARAVNRFELPLVAGSTLADVSSPGPKRNLQYAQAGVFLSRHSHIVIALWNGKDTRLTGGMAQVVHYRLDGGAPEQLIGAHPLLDPEERGPVFHILTPRVKDPEVVGNDPFSVCHLYPGNPVERESVRRMYESTLARLDQFNEDVLRKAPPASGQIPGKGLLHPPEAAAGEGPANCHPFVDLFAKADALAIAYRRRHSRGIAALTLSIVAGTLSLGFFDCYGSSTLWPTVDWRWIPVSLFFFFFAVTAALWYVFVRRRDVQSRYLDYRALAEGIRVQHYWNMAGIPESVADHYLGKQVGELAWIRYAIRTYVDVLGAKSGGRMECRLPMELADRLATANALWVTDQAGYYSRNVVPKDRRARASMTLAKVLAIASIAFVIPLLVVVLRFPNDLFEQVLLYECASCGVLATALTAFAKVMAFDSEALQYQRMSHVLARGKNRIEAALDRRDYGQVRQLLTEVGNETLAENGDWVLTHRDRPLDVPGLG